MTDTASKDLKEAFNINDDLDQAPSPPGIPRLKQESAQINDSSSSDDENDIGVVLEKGKFGNPSATNQPFNLLHDPTQSSMAKVLAGQVPDTSSNTIVNKPQVNSKAPNVQVQGEGSASVYDADTVDDDKPWLKPGADITDYFNYGFDEETWKIYCEKQRMIRAGLDPKTARAILQEK